MRLTSIAARIPIFVVKSICTCCVLNALAWQSSVIQSHCLGLNDTVHLMLRKWRAFELTIPGQSLNPALHAKTLNLSLVT